MFTVDWMPPTTTSRGCVDQPLPVSVMTMRLMPGVSPDSDMTTLEVRFENGSFDETSMLKEFNTDSSVPLNEESEIKLVLLLLSC